MFPFKLGAGVPLVAVDMWQSRNPVSMPATASAGCWQQEMHILQLEAWHTVPIDTTDPPPHASWAVAVSSLSPPRVRVRMAKAPARRVSHGREASTFSLQQ